MIGAAHGSAVRYIGPRQIVIDGKPTPTPTWEPDRSFAGQTVVIIGSGPSLADLPLAVLKGHRFIAVNSACRVVRPIASADDPLYFTDNSWQENRPHLSDDWPGPLIAANRNAKARLGDRLRHLDVTALCWRLGAFPDHAQASSGHIAACLAADMGATRIVLYAFEAAAVNGRTHGHGDYVTDDLSVFTDRFVPGWNGLAGVFARAGVDVINATPGGAIEVFPRMSLADALC